MEKVKQIKEEKEAKKNNALNLGRKTTEPRNGFSNDVVSNSAEKK